MKVCPSLVPLSEVEITETNKSPKNRQSQQPKNAKLDTTISPLCSVFYSTLSCITRRQLKKTDIQEVEMSL